MAEQADEEAIDVYSRKWLFVVVLCGMLPLLLFAHHGDLGRGRAAAIFTFTVLTAIRALLKLKNHVWFWVMVVLVIALHAALVFLVPWPDVSVPGYGLLPLALLDYGIVWGSIKLVELVMIRNDGTRSLS